MKRQKVLNASIMISDTPQWFLLMYRFNIYNLQLFLYCVTFIKANIIIIIKAIGTQALLSERRWADEDIMDWTGAALCSTGRVWGVSEEGSEREREGRKSSAATSAETQKLRRT